MTCKNLKVPQPPTLEQIPPGLNLPKGMSVDSLKDQASGASLSNALGGAGDMIGSGLKKLGKSLTPSALTDSITSAVDGIAGGITDTVKGALDGVTNLKDRLSSFDPKSAADKLAGGVKGKISAISGTGEFANIQASISSAKCDDKYIKEAGQVSKGLKDAAASAIANTTPKERVDAARDPVKKAALQQKAETAVADDTIKRSNQTATTPDKSERSAQDDLQSDELDVKKPNGPSGYFWLTGRREGANYSQFQPPIFFFFGKLWYTYSFWSRGNSFRKFGFFGITDGDAQNALDAIISVGQEAVARMNLKQSIASLETRLVELGMDSQPYIDLYPINKLTMSTVIDKKQNIPGWKPTLETAWYGDWKVGMITRELYSRIKHKTRPIDDDHFVAVFEDQMTIPGTQLADIFQAQVITQQADPLTPRDLTSGVSMENLDYTTPRAHADDAPYWSKHDENTGVIDNFKKVLVKKKDKLAKNIQGLKEDFYKTIDSNRPGSLSISDDEVLAAIKRTYNKPEIILAYCTPELSAGFADYMMLKWDPSTGAVSDIRLAYPAGKNKDNKSRLEAWGADFTTVV